VLALSTIASVLAAQPRTERLRSSEWTFEGGVGAEMLRTLFVTAQPSSVGTVTAAYVAVSRYFHDSPVAMRLGAWLIGRRGRTATNPPAQYTHSVFGIILGTHSAIPIGSSMSIAPSVGLGVAPSVRASRSMTGDGMFEGSSSAKLWTMGMAWRKGRLTIEQHLIALIGADLTVSQHREYYPLTIGWRF
jgi:hypothetical protein